MAHPQEQQPPRKPKRREQLEVYCLGNLKKYLQETTLHGLKYLVDNSLNGWEKLFFLAAFVICCITVIHLISNIYAKWESTPVIIGISPHPTPILKIPLPALTLCNMNQAMYSKVANYTKGSREYAALQYLCHSDIFNDPQTQNLEEFKNNSLELAEFIIAHSQPCSRMLVACQLSSVDVNCSELFREVVTDEGLCCAFNTLHPRFLYKGKSVERSITDNYRTLNDLIHGPDLVPIDWNPETGYPTKLPPKYYPRPTYGTGISLGVSVMLNADVDEYYCSSSSGAGFKVNLGSPVDRPLISEGGVAVPLGSETRFRIDAQLTESSPAIRSINRRRRRCVFLDEQQLVFYRYYTKTHCENECLSAFLIEHCGCIPYYLPVIYDNATFCNISRLFCIEKAKLTQNPAGRCMSRCHTPCVDLTFMPDAFSSPLAMHNYTIQSEILTNLPKEEVQRNIAVIHFYYRESVINAELKNVYIGFTEFLSNTGGILGLFMGFSFISIAEIVYFSLLRPIFKFVVPEKDRNSAVITQVRAAPKVNKNWLPEEICRVATKSHNTKRRDEEEERRYSIRESGVL
ncbi:pickpocket protein 28 [Musca domestica]|uniref:Pickpocket protein 28 n=1 Tax=Musca domestica TaxID=7370 RepID=A0A9J7DC82_MUSDO|nr:pickpocket protein 28 [Musca domestica]